MFGASWGGGSPDNNNGDKNGDKRPRVETRGPPDLNTRLPPTAPGSDDGNGGGGGGFFSTIGGGGGGGGSSRERVKTVGPPDAGKRRALVCARFSTLYCSHSHGHSQPRPKVILLCCFVLGL